MQKSKDKPLCEAFVDVKNHGTLMCKLNYSKREVQIKAGDIISVISFDERGNLLTVV